MSSFDLSIEERENPVELDDGKKKDLLGLNSDFDSISD
jgi:hypothetical protein